MAHGPIQLDTTLAWAKGGYTVPVELGSDPQRVNLLLDSGSSTLAVNASAYRPDRDRHLAATVWAQDIRYGGGALAGPVLRSSLALGEGHHARRIDDALFALVETPGSLFREADGIFGLAYRELDPAHDVEALLRARGVSPALSWPWPFDTGDASGAETFRTMLLQQPRVALTPTFTALEEEGVVRNLFALQVPRAVVHVLSDGASGHALAADPLNRGKLVLGGGPEAQSLYQGAFQDVRVVHDLYYNANLRAIRVGDGARIEAPPLAPSDTSAHGSNALLDTGSSFLVLEQSLFDALLDGLARHDPALPALVAQSREALARGQGLPVHAVDTRRWPDLHLHLESPQGGETTLRIAASHYWPRNALHAGQTLCLLMPQLPHWPAQSILGLPLFAGRYAVFDRRAYGAGVVRFAQAAA
ncbi:pepsin-like aspartic protease [Arenimonas sp. MALMAid1274]|uniref:pepsin-like aspartic protease n=1 Tax=Arenimonas sp. MALMAid1274 TaxID=3411630 RepID=UPI003BA21027